MVGALIDNAMKYSSSGGAIDVSLSVKRRQVQFDVSNAVDGIDPAEVDRWFDRFYQSDQSRTHKKGGYGIGLSMVGSHELDYDSLLVLTHFKGHVAGGFGGSNKNIGIGCADGRIGKKMIHQADTNEQWGVAQEELMERISESSKATADHFGDRIAYVNVMLFIANCTNRRAYYTAPIKALVSEKFFNLVDVLGKDNVGMITGDASINAGAPVICCTAEILANQALREGESTDVGCVVMDEFHFYADPDRGWAWQVPLLTLPHVQFLLMAGEPAKLADHEGAVTPVGIYAQVAEVVVGSDEVACALVVPAAV